MRKIKEILRLHFEQKLGQRQIARSANISQSTVHEYLMRMKAAQLQWPLGEEWDEERLEQALFPPGPTPESAPKRAQPDFVHIRQQLGQHRDLTLELLWEEYREQHAEGYCYSRFCKLYRRWKKQQDVVLRKDDSGRITIGKVDILTEHNEVVYSQVEAMIQDAPPGIPPLTFSHTNFIILDRTNVLTTIPREQFFRLYFLPELRAALAAATFREVFFLTKMKNETGFIPLNTLLLMAEVYFFNAIYTVTKAHKRFVPPRAELEVFGSYLARHVERTVMFWEEADGSEVIYGDSGFFVAHDRSIYVRTYQDGTFPSDARQPETGLASQLGSDFMEKLAEHHESNTFVTPLLFPTKHFQPQRGDT